MLVSINQDIKFPIWTSKQELYRNLSHLSFQKTLLIKNAKSSNNNT